MRRRRLAALLVTLLAAAATSVALAQHHRHRHGHGTTTHADADAGTQAPAPAVDAGVDARTGPSHGPTRNGPSGDCIQHWRMSNANPERAGGARTCDEDTDCVLAPARCCLHCDQPLRAEDAVAIARNALENWSEAICTSEDDCARCQPQNNPDLQSRCIDGLCAVYVRDPCP